MAIVSFLKGLIGKKDINWDEDGTSSQFTKATSKGKTRSDFLINADYIPVTTLVRAKKYADQTTVTSRSDFHIDKVLVQILDNLEKIGLPDTANFFSIAVSGGSLTIQAGKITATELATDAVTTVKILNDAVTTDKLAADAVTSAKIADNQVDSEHINGGALDHEHYSLNSIGPENLDMDDAGNQPKLYPVWGAVNHNPNVAANTFTISVSGSPKTVTTGMSANVWFGDVNVGGLSIENSYVSSTNTITVVVTGTTDSTDTFSYIVWDLVVDKT